MNIEDTIEKLLVALEAYRLDMEDSYNVSITYEKLYDIISSWLIRIREEEE